MSRPAAGPSLVDWSLLLMLLRKHAGPLARLAPLAGMDERTINRLARGEIQQPRFSQALLLLDLAHDHLPGVDWERVRQTSPIARSSRS